ITKEQVQTEFGRRGLIMADELIEKGIVTYADGRMFLKENIKFSQEATHKLLLNLIEQSYDLDTFGEGKNWLTVQYESVDLDYVRPKLRDILVKANQQIR